MIVDKKDDFKTVVIFRYWFPPCDWKDFDWEPKAFQWRPPKSVEKRARKEKAGQLIALFPEVSDSYEHDGCCFSFTEGESHGQANIHWIMQTSVPATDEEVKPFKKYLEEQWGYDFIVRKKVTQAMNDKRNKDVESHRKRGK